VVPELPTFWGEKESTIKTDLRQNLVYHICIVCF
jgi:hypothetical protein